MGSGWNQACGAAAWSYFLQSRTGFGERLAVWALTFCKLLLEGARNCAPDAQAASWGRRGALAVCQSHLDSLHFLIVVTKAWSCPNPNSWASLLSKYHRAVFWVCRSWRRASTSGISTLNSRNLPVCNSGFHVQCYFIQSSPKSLSGQVGCCCCPSRHALPGDCACQMLLQHFLYAAHVQVRLTSCNAVSSKGAGTLSKTSLGCC